ncbi:hypothetical protein HMPREF9444_00889 [Succinatimonas hippei YIT 12066]|uniref:Uncharacterized protein n=1 Tax=Succinatimonas hippei (strain DSM 22608 / JCM 16073 / KCTC 15190 / YIT 12066) TaxID=762983 RepID=E8LJL0_SUCHY|nr:hypothetical protein HMPREF9444_00889 [Succinatimonas hippei YIT 12066]
MSLSYADLFFIRQYEVKAHGDKFFVPFLFFDFYRFIFFD